MHYIMQSQLVIRLPQAHKLLLEQLAHQQEVSVSVVVRLALDSYLNQVYDKATLQSNLLLDLGHSTPTKKGPRNLASGYKKVLYQ